MRNCLVIILALLLFCSCEEQKKEVKDINEILPSSSNEYRGDNQESDVPEDQSNYSYMFKEFFPNLNQVLILQDNLFPDRLRPDTSFKYSLFLQEDTVQFHIWQFKDSTKLKSAFYNWLDVFGDKEAELLPLSSINVQESAFILLLGDTNLVYIENTSDVKNWIQYLNQDFKERKWRSIISQRRKGKTVWYEYIEEKLNKIENK